MLLWTALTGFSVFSTQNKEIGSYFSPAGVNVSNKNKYYVSMLNVHIISRQSKPGEKSFDIYLDVLSKFCSYFKVSAGNFFWESFH